MKRRRKLWEGLAVAKRFWPDLAPYRISMLAVGVVSLGSIGLELLRPWPIKWILDGALLHGAERPWTGDLGDVSGGPAAVIAKSALALAAITIVRAFFEYFIRMRSTAVGHALTRSLRQRIFRHLTRLSPGYHAEHKSGDLLVRLIGDVPMLRTMLVDSSTAIVTRSLLVVGTLAFMLSVDAFLTLLLLATIPVFLGVVWLLSRRITIAVRKQRRKEGVLADFLHEAIAAAPTIQSLGRGEHTVHRFARDNRRSVRAGMKAARLAARLSATVDVLLGSSMAMALAIGSHRVLNGHLSPGELIVFLSYVRGLLKPIRSASRHAERVAKGTACGERILSVLDATVEVQDEGALVPNAIPHKLSFDDVTFHYHGEHPALERFSAEFRQGELTGLVGRSGAGKSTVAALALRLFDPDSGCVRLDGVDLRDLELSALRDRFGLSMQDAVLFGESIRENLLLGDPEASDEELLEACRMAAADGFVARLPEALDTYLGAGGAGISGGERRRLCLARALLRRSPILIVDEPFSGLDAEAVARVRQTLVRLARDRIVIVIAHDLDNLDALDRIVFVENGAVQDEGRHMELYGRNESYRGAVRTVEEVGL